MRYQRLALIGTAAAFSLVAAGCTASGSPGAKPSASTTGSTGSGSAVASAARGGCGHDPDGGRRRSGEPLGGSHPDVRGAERPVRGPAGEQGEYGNLQDLQ